MIRVSWPARWSSPESWDTPRLSPVNSFTSATRAIVSDLLERAVRFALTHQRRRDATVCAASLSIIKAAILHVKHPPFPARNAPCTAPSAEPATSLTLRAPVRYQRDRAPAPGTP